MHRSALRRKGRPRARVLWVALLLAVCTGGTAIAAVGATKPHHLAGTWSGRYGGAFSGTFRLHWKQTGTKLSGTIALSKPHGTYGITGSVHGTAIKFGAVAVGATYTGSVSGKSMSGHYRTPQGGGAWNAHKTS
jgi:hypothetical protein